MKLLLLEVEVTTPYIQMDLDQDIKVMNQKAKNASPEERQKMEDSRTFPSPKMLASTFETLIESPEAEITAISVVIYEQFPTGNSGNIPASVQELVYGGKTAGVGTSSKPLDKENELLSSSKEVLVPRKDRGPLEGLDTHVLQRKSSKDKRLVEKTKHFVRGPKERVVPKEGQLPSGSPSSLQKQESASTSAKNANKPLREA
ncbi:hypothetical protein O181_094151 [Austropuccinia psidii MF-1]|uniref:Uncharacterized protein n=1 Tax=Austropuccinia psidii MF-1 TaxID=1389203 RepID=A0A9Q3PC52_9BASI|nr:hypothetical protein [Austropuccinia psidii MF-1]